MRKQTPGCIRKTDRTGLSRGAKHGVGVFNGPFNVFFRLITAMEKQTFQETIDGDTSPYRLSSDCCFPIF